MAFFTKGRKAQRGRSARIGNIFELEALEKRVFLSTTATLSPVADAYVQNDATSTNYGASSELIVKNASSPARHAYLRFDIDDLTTAVEGATLRLYGKQSPGTTSAANMALYGVADTTWSELGVTWNTPKPTMGETALDTETVSGTTAVWYEWNVASYVEAARAANQQYVSFGLQSTNGTSSYATFNSREYGTSTLRPQLVVTSEDAAPTLAEYILDNDASSGVTKVGSWTNSTTDAGYYGANYAHDANGSKGNKSVTYTPTIANAGAYDVYARWTANNLRATNVPIDVAHDGVTTTVVVNQQTNNNAWVKLGNWAFATGTGGSVTIRTTGTDGFVIADAVRFTQVTAPAAPAAPTAVLARAGSTATQVGIDLTWSDESANEGGFLVERSGNGGGTWTTIATTVAEAESYFDYGSLSTGTSYLYRVTAINAGGASTAVEAESVTTLAAAGVRSTYGGTAWPIAAGSGGSYVEAEDFDAGGEGIAYHDSTAGNAGNRYRKGDVDVQQVNPDGIGSPYSIAWWGVGEWQYYTINVLEAGTYRLEATVASDGAGGTFHGEFSGGQYATGTVVTPQLAIPDTGSGDQTTVIGIDGIDLRAGVQTLRVYCDALSGGNFGEIDRLRLIRTAAPIPGALILDNNSTGVTTSGSWTVGTSSPGYYGANYLHDNNASKGSKSVTYTPTLTQQGRYEVAARWAGGSNRATNVPHDVLHKDGSNTYSRNQTTNSATWSVFGTYRFDAGTGGSVTVRTTGTSGYVEADAVRFTLQAPDAPSGLSATPSSSSQVDLTWTAAFGAAGYKVERRAYNAGTSTWGNWGVVTSALPANATTYADTGVAASTQYEYRLIATNAAGDSAASATDDATTPPGSSAPAAPTDLTATAVSPTQIDLAWTDNATNETGYKVESSTDGGVTFTQVALLAADATTYGVTGLSASTQYHFRVRASNAVGNSGYSNVDDATTAPAVIVHIAAGSATTINESQSTNFTLNLDATGPSAGSISSWQIDWGDAGGSSQTVNGNPSSQTHAYRDGYAQHTIIATAYVGSTAYAAHESIVVTVNDVLPTITLARIDGSGAINEGASATIGWTINDPGFDTVDEISVNWGDGETTPLGAGEASESHSFDDGNNDYPVVVTVTNEDGTFDSQPINIAVVNVAPTVTLLSAPTTLAAGETASFSASAVDPSMADSTDITYAWWVTTNNTTVSSGGPASTFSFSPATSGSYTVHVTAQDKDGGVSIPATTILAVTESPINVPASATGLQATIQSTPIARLTWSDSATNESGYRVYRRTLGSETWARVGGDLPTNTRVYADDSVQPLTQYEYHVTAFNALGESDPSSSTLLHVPTKPSSLGFDGRYLTAGMEPLNYGSMVSEMSTDATFANPTIVSGGQFAVYSVWPSGSHLYFRCKAINFVGESSYSDTLIYVTPLTNVQVEHDSGVGVNLTWDQAAPGTEVQIVRTRQTEYGAKLEQPRVIANVKDVGMYHDADTLENEVYAYALYATHRGIWSSPVMTKPGSLYDQLLQVNTSQTTVAPSNVSVVQEASSQLFPFPGDPTKQYYSSQLLVSWMDNSDSEDQFFVDRSFDGGTTWGTVAYVERHAGTGVVSGRLSCLIDNSNLAGLKIRVGSSTLRPSYEISAAVTAPTSPAPTPEPGARRHVFVAGSFSATGVAEGNTATFTVTRRSPDQFPLDKSEPLTVLLSVPQGTATEGVDYQALPRSITIPAGSDRATIDVVTIEDSIVEKIPDPYSTDEFVSIAILPGADYSVNGSPYSGSYIESASDFSLVITLSDDDSADLDADSDNTTTFVQPNGPYGAAFGSEVDEDLIEDDPSLPGKIIVVNDGDLDNDGIPGYADGYNLRPSVDGVAQPPASKDDYATERFNILSITVAGGIDHTKAKIRMTYDAADPLVGVSVSADGTYGLTGEGRYRLWGRGPGAGTAKTGTDRNNGGNYYSSGTTYSLFDLTGGQSIGGFLLEAVRPSKIVGEDRIVMEIDPEGTGDFRLVDAVRVTAIGGRAPALDRASGVGADGTYRLSDEELPIPGLPTPWTPTTQEYSSSISSAVFQTGFGNGFQAVELPKIIDTGYIVIASVGGETLYFDTERPATYYESRYGSRWKLVAVGTTTSTVPGVYQLVDPAGNRYVFEPTDRVLPSSRAGSLSRYIDAGGNETTVSYNAAGQIATIDRGSIVATFSYHAGTDRVSGVSVTNSSGLVVTKTYEYYSAADEAATSEFKGNEGDLRSVVTSGPDGEPLGTKYYRFYKRSTSADISRLKYVIDEQGTALATGSGVDTAGADDAEIAPYALLYLEYDNDGRVITRAVRGAGESSTSAKRGLATYRYAYVLSPTGTTSINGWKYRVDETAHGADDSVVRTTTRYYNYVGQEMLVVEQSDGAATRHYTKYDAEYRVILETGNDAIEEIDPSYSGLVELGNAGSIYTTTYAPSNRYWLGMPAEHAVRHGVNGTDIKLTSFTYGYRSINGANLSVAARIFLPFTSSMTSYSQTGNSSTTSFTYDDLMGLQPGLVTVTRPKVLPGQNETGATRSPVTRYDSFGRLLESTDGDGKVSKFVYDPTNDTDVVVQSIADYGGANLTTDVLAWDRLGRATQLRDPKGNITNISYVDTATTRTVTVSPPAGPQTQIVENLSDGTITTKVTAHNGSLATIEKQYLDYGGRVVRHERYDGAGNTYATEFAYDGTGNLSRTTSAAGTVYETTFNGLGWALSDKIGATTLREYEYDDGDSTGNGNLTKVTETPRLNQPERVTQYHYDWRNRLVATDNGPSIVYRALDNLDRVTAESVYDGNLTDVETSEGEVLAPLATALRARSEYQFDSRGRVFRSIQRSVGQTDGTLGAGLTTNLFYDGRDNVIRTEAPDGIVTVNVYDGAGRLTDVKIGDGTTDVMRTHTQYDDNGNPILVGTSEWDERTSQYRVSRVASYFDAANRLTATADVGTGTAPDLNAIPPRTDSVHVTSYVYDPAGNAESITDPMDIVTMMSHDALGRLKQITRDFGGLNRTTTYLYDGLDHVTKSTDVVPGGTNQVTNYVYGTSIDGGSAIDSFDLLGSIQYPGYANNATAASEVFTYNALGETASKRDRNNVTHAYVYDSVGHVTSDTATITNNEIDDTVTKLRFTYDVLGRQTRLTSYSPNDAVINDVLRKFNGLGQLQDEYQQHGDTATTASPNVHYEYDQAGNRSRLASIQYPDGRTVSYGYGDAGGIGIGRVKSIGDVEDYEYLGLGTVRARATDAGENVITYDAFGRVQDTVWSNGGTLDSFHYTYDRNGNTLSRLNQLRHALDATWTVDHLGQKTSATIGSITLTPDVAPDISSTVAIGAASWTMDAQGNRTGGRYGTGYDVDDRPNDGSYIPSGLAQSLDFSGSNHAGLKFDAWGRLVRIEPSTPTVFPASATSGVVTYQYDAAGRRVQMTQGGVTTHDYYDGTSLIQQSISGTTPVIQYVIGVDGQVVRRDRDTDGNGSLDEKLWALHDAEGNTTALVDNAANVVERIAYDVDGRPTAMTEAWVGHGVGTSPVTRDARASMYNFEFLSEGNRWQAVFYDVLAGGTYEQGGGLNMTADGQWINTRTGRLLAPNAAITSSGNPYDPHMDSYSESWGWQALGYAGVAALTFATGGAGALAYLGVGTIGGAAIGGTYSYTNGGDFWSGAETGAMVGSFVGGVPGLMRGAEALVARAGTFAYNESVANVRWLRGLGSGGPFTPAAQLAGGGTFAGAFGGETAAAARSGGFFGGANANWGGLFGNTVFQTSQVVGQSAKSVPQSLLRNSQGRILSKDYTAYVGIKDGQPIYVGITRQALVDRLAQHGARFDELRAIAGNLTRRQARAIEQLLIERNPHFINEINSIGSYRTWYDDAIHWARRYMRAKGR